MIGLVNNMAMVRLVALKAFHRIIVPNMCQLFEAIFVVCQVTTSSSIMNVRRACVTRKYVQYLAERQTTVKNRI